MKIFMDTTEHEQRLRMTASVPSVEEYLEYRLGTSAVGIMLAINECAALEV